MCGPQRQQVAQGPDGGHWFRHRLPVSLEAGREQWGRRGSGQGGPPLLSSLGKLVLLSSTGAGKKLRGGCCWERHEAAETGDRRGVEVTVMSAPGSGKGRRERWVTESPTCLVAVGDDLRSRSEGLALRFPY